MYATQKRDTNQEGKVNSQYTFEEKFQLKSRELNTEGSHSRLEHITKFWKRISQDETNGLTRV